MGLGEARKAEVCEIERKLECGENIFICLICRIHIPYVNVDQNFLWMMQIGVWGGWRLVSQAGIGKKGSTFISGRSEEAGGANTTNRIVRSARE